MQDIYGAIIGEPPSDEEKLALLAKKLRGRNQLGALIQLSGDKVAAPIGKGISEQTEAQAELMGRMQARKRELVAQREMAEIEDKAALARIGAQGDRAMALEKARQAFEREQKALDRQNDLDVAGMKGKGGYKKFTAKDIERLSEAKEGADDLGVLAESFEDSFGGTGIPGVRPMSNTLSAMGMGTDDMDKAQKWWSEYARLYELPTRNKLFGSALTAQEQKAWREANITQNMRPDQIRANLKTLYALRDKAITKMQKRLKVSYDPDDVDMILGNDISSLGDEEGGGGGGAPSTNPADYPSYEAYLEAVGGG